MPKNPSKLKPPQPTDQVQIKFNVPVEMPSVFATNIVIQPLEHEMLVSFYEIQPPLLGGTNEAENMTILKKIGIRADCVGRITISKQRFEGFADAMKKAVTDMKAAEKKNTNA